MNVKEESSEFQNTGNVAANRDEIVCAVNRESLLQLADAFNLKTAEEVADIFLSHDKLVADIFDS
jgi:hypothetical protein